MTMWETVQVKDCGIIHVMPVGDIVDHDMDPKCWCHPLYDRRDRLYIHSSMDGREHHEPDGPIDKL